MSKDKSRLKAGQPSASATPAPADDSLDFSHLGESAAPVADQKPAGKKAQRRRSAAVVQPQKATVSSDRDKAGGSRRVAVPVLIVIAVALIVVFVATDHTSKELAAPSPSAATTSPPREPQQAAPPSKVRTPAPPAATPENGQARKIPPEFLKAFEDYATKSGGKAMALALDSNGKSAYVSITGYPTQSQASEEAMSECMRHKIQAGVQESCRLYAVGDKVVW